MFFERNGRISIEQCQISESYYPLRTDYDRLLHGTYWLKLLETSVMPDTEMRDVYVMSLRALAFLTYSEIDPRLLTMAFEMQLMYLLGMSPRVDSCIRCGAPIDGDAHFDALLGGCICGKCPTKAPFLSNEARRVMLKMPRVRYDQVQLLVDYPAWPEAARMIRPYVDDHLQQRRFAPALPDIAETR